MGRNGNIRCHWCIFSSFLVIIAYLKERNVRNAWVSSIKLLKKYFFQKHNYIMTRFYSRLWKSISSWNIPLWFRTKKGRLTQKLKVISASGVGGGGGTSFLSSGGSVGVARHVDDKSVTFFSRSNSHSVVQPTKQ